MPFVNEEKPGLHRTIDYERNAIMSSVKGSSVGIVDFKIIWNDAQIEFSAKEEIQYEGKSAVSVQWQIRSFQLPEFLEPRRPEVIDMIEEALKTYGLYGRKNWNGFTQVSLNPLIER